MAANLTLLPETRFAHNCSSELTIAVRQAAIPSSAVFRPALFFDASYFEARRLARSLCCCCQAAGSGNIGKTYCAMVHNPPQGLGSLVL
jgi:hypothetical protein